MKITALAPQPDWTLAIVTDDGRTGMFDVHPYLEYETFEALKDIAAFKKVSNGGYFVEWECGADLSADTIEARMKVLDNSHASVVL
ncbi:MAG: DUF2442 domain-containing protein [Chitinivibrionales bacterium]|nr:DUF2442 domain-containing protein [Chitinivibrionales bacterium]